VTDLPHLATPRESRLVWSLSDGTNRLANSPPWTRRETSR